MKWVKLLFVHDIKLRCVEGKMYTAADLTDDVTQRYTKLVNELTIACRIIEKQSTDTKLTPLENPKLRFISIGKKGIRPNKEERNTLEEAIIEADAVIVRLPSFIGPVAIKLVKKHCKPYMVEMVSCPWDALWNHGFCGKILAPYMYGMTKYLVARAPRVAYVTESFLQSRYPTKGKTLACSDVELCCVDLEDLDRRKKQFQKTKEVITIGTIGAVDVKYKGQKYVIKALAELKKEGKLFRYEMVGGGNNRYLQTLAKKYGVEKQIRFIGSLSHDEVFKWLRQIDLYIQPSKQEGLPRALVEAMSTGAPAIGATTGGIPELLPATNLFAKGNVGALCQCLRKVEHQWLMYQSEYSIEKAKGYRKHDLDQKREAFYLDFLKEIEK